MLQPLRPVALGLLLLLAVTSPSGAQTPPEQPKKGLGGLLGKAADRLKDEAMKRFDKNGDGRLDDAERAEAMDALKKKGGELQSQLKQFMLRRFDADGDGTLDETERKVAFDETMKQLEQNGPMVKNTILGMVHRRFDTDGDGTLDEKELGTARAELTKRIIQGVSGVDAASPPVDPATRRRQAEESRRKEMLDRFDTNGDGQLDEREREAAKAELKRRFEELDGEAPSTVAPPAATR